MKKKNIVLISLILIVLVVVVTAFIIKDNSNDVNDEYIDAKNGYINEKTFKKLIEFEINSEERVQIIDYPALVPDMSSISYYNFKFNEGIVISVSKHTNCMPMIDEKQRDTFLKYEYKITDEEIAIIKEKLESIKRISDEGETRDFSLAEYCIRMKGYEKTFSGNKAVNEIVREIMQIVWY